MIVWRWLAVAAALTAASAAQTRRPAERPQPSISRSAPALGKFAPEGWKVEQQKAADLNRDGSMDALLLLAPEQPNGSQGRILAIVLGDPRRTGAYTLAETNDTLIPPREEQDQEAEEELAVRPGGFDVRITLSAAAGSYLGVSARYRFRHQNGCFRLIGYDRMETHRATMAIRDLSVNFLTRTVLHRTGTEGEGPVKERRERMKPAPLPCFRDLGSAATFNPLEPASRQP